MSTIRDNTSILNSLVHSRTREKPGKAAADSDSPGTQGTLKTTKLEFRDNFIPTEDLEEEADPETATSGEAGHAQEKTETAAPGAAGETKPEDKAKPAEKEVAPPEAEKPGNPIADFFGSIFKGIGDIFKGIGECIFGKVTDDNQNDGTSHVMKPGGQGEEVNPQEAGSVTASDGRSPIIVVGGASGTLREGEDFSQYMSDITGEPTRLIHNATNRKVYEGGIFGDLLTGISRFTDGVADFNQVSDDWYGKGDDLCVDAVKDQVRRQLTEGTGEARLVGFSQGNSIIARAMKELAQEPGMADKMSKVSVMNMSGPVREEDYQAQGITYDHLEMASDPVANRLGEAIPDQSGVNARNANYHDTLWGLVNQQPWWGHSPNILLGSVDGSVPDIGADVLQGMGIENMDQMMAIEADNRRRLRELFGLARP